MTAVSVILGALVEVSTGVVIRRELVPMATLALVTSRGIETGLVTASLAGLRTLVYIHTLPTLNISTLVTSPASEERNRHKT